MQFYLIHILVHQKLIESNSMYSLLTIIAGVLWGCISLFLKTLTAAGLTSLQVMMLRGVISALMLLAFILVKDKSLLKIQFRDLWMFIGTGIISLTFFSICYFKTILEIGTSVAVILLYTSPIFVLLMSMLLFKEKINLLKIAALVMTFGGCVLVAGLGGGSAITLKGFVIGLCAGFGYALYSIFSRYALKKYSSFTVTFYTFLFSGLSSIPFVHVEKIPAAMDVKIILFTIGLAFFCTVLPYICYTLGLSGLETGRAAILVTVEPLVGTLIGFFVWGDDVSVAKVIGIILIFAAVILLGLNPEKNKKNNL